MIPLSIVDLQVQLGRRPLFDDLSLELESGELTVLLGPNGCGKSTLLRTICHDIPYQGEIRLFDKPRQHWHAHALARRMVVLPQSSMLGFDFRAREVVELGRYPWSCSRDENLGRIQSSMQSLDVWSLRDAPYQQLSGGEKQRVHFARVLAQLDPDQPGLLLLDEPTSALDPGHQHQTLQLAQAQARAGHSVLIVLHDLNLASRYADRLLLMQEGKIVADGAPASTLTARNLHQLYGVGPELWLHPTHGRPVVI